MIEYKSMPVLFELLVALAAAVAEVLLRRKHLAALVRAANKDGDLALVGFGWRGPFCFGDRSSKIGCSRSGKTSGTHENPQDSRRILRGR